LIIRVCGLRFCVSSKTANLYMYLQTAPS
jgi:hypothetical protein